MYNTCPPLHADDINRNNKDMENNQIAILQPDNMKKIVMAAPGSYDINLKSRDNCVAFGQNILNAIRWQGMDDDLDRQAASFIEKARRTVKVMNERRSPVTKLFDQVRTAFTAIENEVDPAKSGTIGYQLQQLRNQYAAKKREEEERRRQEALARQKAEEDDRRFRVDVEDEFKRRFQQLVDDALDKLSEVRDSVTLDNYEDTLAKLKSTRKFVGEGIPATWMENLHATLRVPMGVNAAEVEKETKEKLAKCFHDQYIAEVGDMIDDIIDRMPSLKANLERIATAKAEEAARLKAEMEARQKAEAERVEKERAAREAEAKAKADMDRQSVEMTSLFNQQATVAGYQPKTKVTKRVRLLNPEGVMPILSLWWSKEGCTLSVEELSKMFKKQITFCEKLANKEDIFVKDESVEYIDEVKAK